MTAGKYNTKVRDSLPIEAISGPMHAPPLKACALASRSEQGFSRQKGLKIA